MLEKIATFSEKLERKGLFDISDKIDKSIKTSANDQRYTFLGYDTKTNGLWYQGEGRYWYLPPGGKQWIPYTNLPGQGGVGQQSLTEDSFSQLYRDPETGYWTSLELQDMRDKTKKDATQMAAGVGGLAVGVPASYALANRNMNLLYKNFSENYSLIEENLAKIKTAKTDKDAQKFYLAARKAAEKAQKAYNRYQGWNKSTPGFDHLPPPQKKILDFRLKEIDKFNKIIETEKTPKGIINKIKNSLTTKKTAKQTAIKTQQATEKIAREMKNLQSKMDFSKNSISKLIKEFNSTKDINKKKELFRLLQAEKQKMGEVYKSLLRYSNERPFKIYNPITEIIERTGNLDKYVKTMQETENIFNNFSTNNPRLYQAVSEPLIKDTGDLLAKRVRNPRVNPAQTAGDIAEQAGRLGDDVARVTGETAEQAVKTVDNTGASAATRSLSRLEKQILNASKEIQKVEAQLQSPNISTRNKQALYNYLVRLNQDITKNYRNLKSMKNNAHLGEIENIVKNVTNISNKLGYKFNLGETSKVLKLDKFTKLLASNPAIRRLSPKIQAILKSKLPEILSLARAGTPIARIAARVFLSMSIIGLVLDLYQITVTTKEGIGAYNAVQEANKNTGLARIKGPGNHIRRILQMDPQRLQSFINTSRPVLQNYARFLNQTDLTQQEKQQFMEILRRNGIPLPTGQDPGSLGGGFWSTVGKSAVDMGKETVNNTANWFKKL